MRKLLLLVSLLALLTICWDSLALAKGTTTKTTSCCVFKAPKAPKPIKVPKVKVPVIKLPKAPKPAKVPALKAPKVGKIPASLKPTKVKAVKIPKLPKIPKTKQYIIVPASVTSFSLTSGFNAVVPSVPAP